MYITRKQKHLSMVRFDMKQRKTIHGFLNFSSDFFADKMQMSLENCTLWWVVLGSATLYVHKCSGALRCSRVFHMVARAHTDDYTEVTYVNVMLICILLVGDCANEWLQANSYEVSRGYNSKMGLQRRTVCEWNEPRPHKTIHIQQNSTTI